MNDEQFEKAINKIWLFSPSMADQLRARNTAQREALARVEAERDAERARGDAAVGDANEAEAQLAEAVKLIGLLAKNGIEDERQPAVVAFLERHWNKTEQKGAQGAQTGDERAAFERKVQDLAERFQPDYRRYGDAGEYKDATLEWAWKLWQARAALATQPAAGEPKPIGYISETVRQELLNGKHVPANICTATPSRRNPHPGPDANWSVPIFVAPPAAAHGDEAGRKMVLPERIDRRQYLGGRGDAVAQGWNDCLNWIDKANAMRAQGDGGEA